MLNANAQSHFNIENYICQLKMINKKFCTQNVLLTLNNIQNQTKATRLSKQTIFILLSLTECKISLQNGENFFIYSAADKITKNKFCHSHLCIIFQCVQNNRIRRTIINPVTHEFRVENFFALCRI